MGIGCSVAASSLLPRRPGDRIKADKRDAIMLTKVLRNNEIVPVYVPTKSDESIHDFLRMCNDMRSDLKKQKQRLLQFLLRLDKKYKTGKGYWTRAHRSWMKSIKFEETVHQSIFEEYYTTILEQEAKIDRLKQKI